MRELFTDAGLVATRDLRIEARSRVLLNQVAPFALLVLVLFGFALDADQRTPANLRPGSVLGDGAPRGPAGGAALSLNRAR